MKCFATKKCVLESDVKPIISVLNKINLTNIVARPIKNMYF